MTNDLFANATDITLSFDGDVYVSAAVSNVGFATETNEPGDGQQYRSAWWTYTPTSSGLATFDTQNSTGAFGTDTLLRVCTGNTLATLNIEALDDDGGGSATSRYEDLPVVGGTTYRIQVTSYYDVDMTYVLRVTGPGTVVTTTVSVPAIDCIATPERSAPINDAFASATNVALVNTGDTYLSPIVNATELSMEAGEPTATTVNGTPISVQRTAWWHYLPQEDGQLTVDTELSAINGENLLAVFTSTSGLAGLTLVAAADNTGATSYTKIQNLAVLANTDHYLRVSVIVGDNRAHGYQLRLTGPYSVVRTQVACPPIDASAEAQVATLPTGRNDNIADAVIAVIYSDGGTYTSEYINNATYTEEPGEPLSNVIGRSAWWRYAPQSNGTLVLDLTGSIGTPNLSSLRVFRLTNPAGAVAFANFTSLGSSPSRSVTAGDIYYIQAGVDIISANRDMTYLVRLTGPRTVTSLGAIGTVPIDTRVDLLDQNVTTGVSTPPIEPVVEHPKPWLLVNAKPIDTGASVDYATILRVRRVLADPPNGAVVPILRPVFTVGIYVVEGSLTETTLDLQYDDNAAFTSPVTLVDTVRLLAGANLVTLTPPADLTPSTVYWRARLRFGTITGGWTDPWSFTLDPSSGNASIPILATVSAGDSDPHLWSVQPPGGPPGAKIRLIGTGFPAQAVGQVWLSGQVLTVDSWTTVAATAAAGTSARKITADIVSPEHDEISVYVPNDATAPGGPLTVVELP